MLWGVQPKTGCLVHVVSLELSKVARQSDSTGLFPADLHNWAVIMLSVFVGLALNLNKEVILDEVTVFANHRFALDGEKTRRN